MLQSNFCVFAACVFAVDLGVLFPIDAHSAGYIFKGEFAPTSRTVDSWSAPWSPSELIGKTFTLAVSWPDDLGVSVSDEQTGADYRGVYSSDAIEVSIDVPGLGFSVNPLTPQWQVFNDTGLDYFNGSPLLSGDELRLSSHLSWFREITVPSWEPPVSFPFSQSESTLSFSTEYLLSLRLIDTTGVNLSDDSLPTRIDPSSFESVKLEFSQVVPVAGGDARPISYQHWIGTVTSIVAVPEPPAQCSWLVSIVVVLWGFRRSIHRKGHLTTGSTGVAGNTER